MTLEVTRTTTTHERDDYGRSTTTTTTRTRVPLTVPTHWSMYTAAGNRSVAKKAATLLRKVEKLVAEGRATRTRVNSALVSFIGSWERMSDSKSYGEAADSAVREQVGGFHDDVFAAVFGECGYDVWENNREEEYTRRVERSKRAKVSKCLPSATGQKAALLAFLTA